MRYWLPKTNADRLLPADPLLRKPAYRRLEPLIAGNLPTGAQIVQLTLPAADQLALWENLDPLESGVGNFPPPLEDTAVSDRIVTWLRVEAASKQPTKMVWLGINAATVTQRVPIVDEALTNGTGDPDQLVKLARRPVLPRSVSLTVTSDGKSEILARS